MALTRAPQSARVSCHFFPPAPPAPLHKALPSLCLLKLLVFEGGLKVHCLASATRSAML